MTTTEATNLIRQNAGKLVRAAIEEYFESLQKQPESDWSKKEGSFEKAKTLGITDGTSPKMFITREQGIAMLTRMDAKAEMGVFNDKKEA